MSLTNSPFWMASTGGGDFYDYTIDQSVRYSGRNSSSPNYFTRNHTQTRTKWTCSWWVKHTIDGNSHRQFESKDNNGASGNYAGFTFNSDGTFHMFDYTSGYRIRLTTDRIFRDSGAWYHFVLRFDSTQSTASNRVRLYVNGEQVSWVTHTTYPSQNLSCQIGNGTTHYIGRYAYNANSAMQGYFAEWNMIDNQSLDATHFGEYKSGIWVPKEYTGTYGTNGFRLDFSNASSLGTDSSGNSKNWTSQNMSTSDQVSDSPTNNFATLHSLAKMGVSNNFNLFEGGLTATYTSNSNWQGIIGNIGVSSGKWYYEVRYDSTGEPAENRVVGWSMLQSGSAFPGGDTSVNYEPDTGIGFKGNSGVVTQGSATNKTNSGFTHSQIIGLAIDLDNRTVDIYKNNVDIGGATSIDEGTYWPCVANYKTSGVRVNFGHDSSFAGAVTAQNNSDENGIGDFYYTPPSGYLAICTSNLPDPAIDPAQDDTPEDYFNTLLYTGNGASSRAITGVGFQPDFAWIRQRNELRSHGLYDAVRGATKVLLSNVTNAELTSSARLSSFDSDGFTVGSDTMTNKNNGTYVAWNWLAGNGTSSNTDGSTTTTVSVNSKAGFSIATYTGTNSSATIGHGLDSAPEMIITKDRDRSINWMVWHKDLTNPNGTSYLALNTTNGDYNDGGGKVVKNVNSSTYTIGAFTAYNANNEDFVAYHFHSVDGYSKFGSYEGNGSSDGAFVYTGFRPAFILQKRYTSNGEGWRIHDNARDPYNVASTRLIPDSNSVEFSGSSEYIDILSNGFKMRTSDAAYNTSGQKYIYMAFAEQPFKYVNAR